MRESAFCRKTASTPLCLLSVRTMRSPLTHRTCALLQQCSLALTHADPKSQGLATDFMVLQKSSKIGVQVLLSYQQPIGKLFACEMCKRTNVNCKHVNIHIFAGNG